MWPFSMRGIPSSRAMASTREIAMYKIGKVVHERRWIWQPVARDIK
jgi:hypothetical protein